MRKRRVETPDGRYVVSRGRLKRNSDPTLPVSERRAWIKKLMQARLATRRAQTETKREAAWSAVQEAKRALGEKGPVWWSDGAPDESGADPIDSSYSEWWTALDDATRRAVSSSRD
ncbi:MAG: hypothetical protein AAFZ06_04100 [Pseudomonadota bacterium]